MPKRKSNSRDDFDYLSKKLKKLEQKIKRGRKRRYVSVSSTDSDPATPYSQQEEEKIIDDDYATYDDSQPGCSFWESTPRAEPPAANEHLPSNPDVINADLPIQSTEAAGPPVVGSPEVPPQSGDIVEPEQPSLPQQDVHELDPELMEILGEDPTSVNEFGSEIQKDLAIRLNHIATSGLSKDIRKELKEKYLVPANCKFIKAPALNPEVRVSLNENQTKRDKGIESKQVLTSCALSSLSEAITHLLSSSHKDQKLLKLLMDTARILADVQYSDSTSRRLFILSTLKKELKEQLGKTKIDEMLFGNHLTDVLKTAKTILRSGADLSSSSTMKSVASKPTKAAYRPLNYRAPPVVHRQRPLGGVKQARPAPAPTSKQTPRPRHNNDSKISSRQPQARFRR